MTAGRYATQTQVESESTRLELERLLRKYGADQFASGWSENTAMVGFRFGRRTYRIRVPLPDPDADEFRLQPVNQYGGSKIRTQRSRDRLYEQVVRTRWRALLLVVRAHLEAVEVGILTFEEAFIANALLPNDQTVGEWAEPEVAAAYETGHMPEGLPGLTPPPTERVLGPGNHRSKR